MRHILKMLSLIFVLVLAVSAFAGCGKQETTSETQGEQEVATTTEAELEASVDPINWKFGLLTNEDHIWYKTAAKFAELVSEKTDGVITVTIYPNETLGSEVDTLNMIQTGTADLTISGESMANWAPKAALLAVPYAFTDADQMNRVINGEIGAEIEQQIIDNVGVMPIYYHLRAPRNLTANIPVRTPEDAAGLKMRVPNVPLFLDCWQAVGAQPQVMAFSDVFTGLQQGVIDGQENPYDLIYSASFYEVQQYVNETEHVNQWVYVVLGKNQFEELTEDLQAAVLEAAEETGVFGNELFETEIASYKQKCIDEGMIIVDDVDKAAFQEAMKPAIEKSLTEEQFELYQRMLQE